MCDSRGRILVHCGWARADVLGFVGKLARRPESEQFFRLAKHVPSASVGNSKQAMSVLSSMQPDAARRTTLLPSCSPCCDSSVEQLRKRAARSQIEFSDRLLAPRFTPMH